MKKILLYITAIIFIAIYCVSSSVPLSTAIETARANTGSLFGSDKYKYGDLYGLCYLPQFKATNDPNMKPAHVSNCGCKRTINLYTICDSYLGTFVKSDSIFCGVHSNTILRLPVKDESVIKTTGNGKNILLIETVERNARTLADTQQISNSLKSIDELKKAYMGHYSKKQLFLYHLKQAYQNIKDVIFCPVIEKTLAFNLTDYTFFSWLKELKAAFNDKVFHRVDVNVSISPGGKHLYLVETTDTTNHSSFSPVDNAEINRIVYSLNNIYSHFKAKGFDEVYFSVIPNPVSIISPEMGNYNHLVERVESDPKLRMPVIDIYHKFKTVNYEIYQPSDTHWNNVGFKLWLDEFNKRLARQCK